MASSPAQKKKEEASLKLLRELISLPNNKQCFECQQKGPTYVDMTTCAFICTQCSGFLRGINPPHRVKSVSMTTFTSEEIQKLRNGGNEIARMIWMSSWDPRKDREPSKKDEQTFKEHLRDKYERKKWYRDPSEVRKDIALKNSEAMPTSKPASLPTPPPQSNTRVSTPPTTKNVPAATAKPQQTPPTATKPKEQPSLIDVFESDPFVAKPPVGGVSVFPSGPPPLSSTTSSSSTTTSGNDFGAFTSSSGTFNGGSGLLLPTNSSTSSNTQQNPQQSSTTPGTISESDRYAALANLDKTLNDIRLVEEKQKEEQQQQQQMIQQQQMMQQQQQQMMLQQQRMMQQQGNQFGQQAMGNQFGQQAMGNQFGQQAMGNQFGQLQKKESNPFLMGGPAPPVTGPIRAQGGFGGFPQGGQMGYAAAPQQGMMGYSPTMVHQPMPMQQASPQQFGGYLPSNQGMIPGGGSGTSGWAGQGQWGMVAAANAGGFSQQQQQFGGFQTAPNISPGIPQQTQFGGFVAAANQPAGTPPMASHFNWSKAPTTPTTTAPAAVGGPISTGWSNQLSKPVSNPTPPQQQTSTTPTGWSTNMIASSGGNASTWGGVSNTASNWGGGASNTASNWGGGTSNTASNWGGGASNTISNWGGGASNTTGNWGGGASNTTSNWGGGAGGGSSNPFAANKQQQGGGNPFM